MPCNVIKAGMCQTEAGDILVVWGDKRVLKEKFGQVYEMFGGEMIISVLREGKNKWYRNDFYIGIVAGGMDIKEIKDGRIVVSYFQGAIIETGWVRTSGTGFIWTSKGWDGWEVGVRGGVPLPFPGAQMTNIVYDRRNGKIYCGQTGVYWWEIEHTGQNIEKKERKKGIVYSTMAMSETGQILGVKGDGRIMSGDVDLNWQEYDEWYQTKVKFVEDTMVIRQDMAGNIWIAGYGQGARKGDGGFGGFGVERMDGKYTQEGIDTGWWKTQPGFCVLSDGRLVIAVPDKGGANIWKAQDKKWYCSGIQFYISNNSGRTFEIMPVKNEGIKIEE